MNTSMKDLHSAMEQATRDYLDAVEVMEKLENDELCSSPNYEKAMQARDEADKRRHEVQKDMQVIHSMPMHDQNREFLAAIKDAEKSAILESISDHYDTDTETIIKEVTEAPAHWLLEYMVEPLRTKTLALWVATGFSVPTDA